LDDLITPETIYNFIIIIVLDLTKPSTLLNDYEKFLLKIENITKNCYNFMIKKNTNIHTKIINKQKNFFLTNTKESGKHEDFEFLKFSGLNLITIANKYDLFQKQFENLFKKKKILNLIKKKKKKKKFNKIKN
jgi:hypothetical protein